MSASSRTSALERPHVLIVSDDPSLREFFSQGLLYAGFWTSAIGSAIQTLEVFRLRSFDLVLIDARLAGMGWLELVRRLRGRSERASPDPSSAHVPILVVAEPSDNVDPDTASAAGADGLLLAPFDLEDAAVRLHETIASWQDNQASRPQKP